jgi:anti-anti-sigma regulatory factor
MTFRVQQSTTNAGLVLAISGDIAADCIADLRALIEGGEDERMVLELADLAVVDRAGIELLEQLEKAGATLMNCPRYVREWIDRERASPC